MAHSHQSGMGKRLDCRRRRHRAARNVYQLTSEEGNSVRATVNPTWIDVAVGWAMPSPVRGLIANPNGNLNRSKRAMALC